MLTLDDVFRDRGTRFRVFAQPPWVDGYESPQTIWLSPSIGGIKPGPTDRRIRTVDADKKEFAENAPTIYRGPRRSAPSAAEDGHFDNLAPGNDAAFIAVHAYACVRRTLDVWEHYLGRRINWPFFSGPISLYPAIRWDNAQFGPGFIEAGSMKSKDGEDRPFGLNFDVMSHETGHAIAFSLGGLPQRQRIRAEFVAFHEAMADVIATVSSLHFSRVLWRVVKNTEGDLYAPNTLIRIGELSRTGEIRDLSSLEKHDYRKWERKGIDDIPSKKLHDISIPFSGALIDIMVCFYVRALARFGAIDDSEEQLRTLTGASIEERARFSERVRPIYRQEPELFVFALAEARDRLAVLIIRLLRAVVADRITLRYAGEILRKEYRRLPWATAHREIEDILNQRGLLYR